MASSLDALAKNLSEDQYKNLSRIYSGKHLIYYGERVYFRMNTLIQLID